MNEAKIHLRPLRTTDIEAIMQLHRELGWNPAFHADGSTLRSRLTTLTEEENALLLVAELNGDVAGYVHGEIVTYLLFAGREMLVSELFVTEAARGRGVGTALMAAMEAEAVKRRCFRISVLNSRERESYKRGFYPSLGYEERVHTANFTKRLDWGESN
ncbi:acetyltransferase [Sulfurifustis variabilis]|uniref:Acetyltransferase n=1 Tax=Sulfurifustis variabilis TaxID=1675686 RepID=A0A1B4V6T2_9GAMM|nr:GNAT family N-acetyltransferase [Sulfurifustis variabilis]BAU46994.1 acetyltransferase [Sulfurifustis variabilis]